jgi:hypothetical protein
LSRHDNAQRDALLEIAKAFAAANAIAEGIAPRQQDKGARLRKAARRRLVAGSSVAAAIMGDATVAPGRQQETSGPRTRPRRAASDD